MLSVPRLYQQGFIIHLVRAIDSTTDCRERKNKHDGVYPQNTAGERDTSTTNKATGTEVVEAARGQTKLRGGKEEENRSQLWRRKTCYRGGAVLCTLQETGPEIFIVGKIA